MAETDFTPLVNYLQVFSKRKKQLLIPLVSMVSLSIVFTLMVPKIYMTSARILARERKVNPVTGVFSPVAFNQQRFGIMVKVIKSRAKIEEIIKELKLEQSVKGPKEFETLISLINKGLSISYENNVIAIKFTGEDPKMNMKIVNTVCGLLINQDINLMYGASFSTYPVLKQLLDHYAEKVSKSRSVLAKFRLENKGVLPRNLDIGFRKAEKLQFKITKILVQIQELYARKESLENKLTMTKDEVEIEPEKPRLTPLESKLKALNNKLKNLKIKYTDHHPEMTRLTQEISLLRNTILRSHKYDTSNNDLINVRKIYNTPSLLKVRKELEETVFTINKLENTVLEREKEQEELNKTLRQFPKKSQDFAFLKRELKVNQGIYNSIQKKLEKTRLAKEIETLERSSRFAILNPATLSKKPISPGMTKNLIASSVLGLILGVALAYWTEFNDDSIGSLKDAQLFLQLPILATIPSVFTEDELIKKRRYNMLITVIGTFYAIFLIVLLVRELVISYSPSLLYMETYTEWLYQLKDLVL